MIIEKSIPRSDWQEKCESVGFNYHSMEGVYWDESHCYRFKRKDIDLIDDVTTELHGMAIAATEAIIKSGDYQRYNIPLHFVPFIEASWKRGDKSLYGRMDISWNGEGDPKLLEYNADTPTALLEASVVQWDWLLDTHPSGDQFNSIHEKLVSRFATLCRSSEKLHLAAQRDILEDINTTEYLLRAAEKAGISTEFLLMDQIGWDNSLNQYVDLQEGVIRKLFKLYPSEWLFDEEFASGINQAEITLLEPAWKVITSSKAILVKLWELFPNHPNLLPASFSEFDLKGDHVRKPVFSREGANIQTRVQNTVSETPGGYEGPFIYQAYRELGRFNDRYAVIGSWVIGDEAAGIGIREDSTPITRNTSCFVPHYFKD